MPCGRRVADSLSEDFVTSYRMHPLLPDDYIINGHKVGRLFWTGLYSGRSCAPLHAMLTVGLSSAR